MITQHELNLLPVSIRLKNQAGARAGRFVAVLIGAIALVVVLATHSRLQLDHAQKVLQHTQVEADQVLETEARAEELRQTLAEGREAEDRYHELALPLEISSVIATLVNAVPEGMSLDRLDLDAGARRFTRSARSKGPINLDGPPPRLLTGEISGFAKSDDQVALLDETLNGLEPFRNVSVDYSRNRTIRGAEAREFRLSFQIDLDVRYEVTEAGESLASAGEEAGDVQ